jgi:superfamily II DNA or RNA helicase
MNYLVELGKILKEVHNWAELKSLLSTYNTSVESHGIKNSTAGKLFEYFAKYYFLVEPKIKSEINNAWLFHEIPINIKSELNINHADYGIDLVIQDKNEDYIAVQCKFKNDETEKLGWSKDKIGNFFGYANSIQRLIIFSNSSEIDEVIKTRTDQLCFISVKDLLEIGDDTFSNIYNLINNFPEKEIPKALPYNFQLEVITKTMEYLEFNDSGKLILPCGTGKTLISLWIKESLLPKVTLVLFPSLALLRQTKNEWMKNKSIDFQYIVVCSESDINNQYDSCNINLYDLDSFVTTDPLAINNFINKNKRMSDKVIYSTYQSLPKIAEALNDSETIIDLAICDESHKTAGSENSLFSIVHSNNNIRINKRLYMTATPRVFSDTIKRNMYDENIILYDMSDTRIFGQEIYRMSFAKAIELDILVDYQIICIGISDDDIQKMISDGYLVEGDQTFADYANNYALKQVFEEYDINHVITFHSRIENAESFSSRSKQIMPSISSFFVSGQQSTTIRSLILDNFQKSQKAIISNSRCLTEGIDVPIIDAVFFCDPKNSKIDVVQAAGRALRKSDKIRNKTGKIIIPIYHSNKLNVEDAIDSSIFKNVVKIIRSLAEHDERLQDEINYFAHNIEKKSRPIGHIQFTSSKILESIIRFEHFETRLKESLFNEIIKKNSTTWELYFLELKDFINENKSLPSSKLKNSLTAWINKQRMDYKSGRISLEKILKLESIGFIWDLHEDSWNEFYEQIVEHNQNNQFEPDQNTYPTLYRWFQIQKRLIKNGTLKGDRLIKLQSINYIGTAIDKNWEDNFATLLKFRENNPNLWPRQRNTTGIEHKLAVWMLSIGKEFRSGKLRQDRFKRLVDIGYIFDDRRWLLTLEEVKSFIEENKKFPGPTENKIENNLWRWLKIQHEDFKNNKMDDRRLELLKSIGFEKLSVLEQDSWEDIYETVFQYYSNNDSNLPGYYDLIGKNQKISFGRWASNQRVKYKNKLLSESQIQKLLEIGFVFDTQQSFQQKWDEKFERLKKWVQENDGNWPGNNISEDKEERELSIFVNNNRSWHNGKLSKYGDYPIDRKLKLESIGFNWQTKEPFGRDSRKLWDQNFIIAKEQLETIGKIPYKINGKVNKTYTWFSTFALFLQIAF